MIDIYIFFEQMNKKGFACVCSYISNVLLVGDDMETEETLVGVVGVEGGERGGLLGQL